jgi:membrane-bound lytic murein transglycosylase C
VHGGGSDYKKRKSKRSIMLRNTSLNIFSLCMLCVCQIAIAEDFNAYRNQLNKEFRQTVDEFDEYRQQLQNAFSKYKAETAQVWGDGNNPVDDKKTWVSYQGDLRHRSIVDFESGVVNVEVAVPVDRPVSDNEAREDLKQTIVNTLNQGTDTRSILEIAKQPVARPSGPAVLSGQVADTTGNAVSDSGYVQLATKLADNSKKKVIKGADGKSRYIYGAQFRLVPDHIRKRAMVYQDEVNKNARAQRVPSALIYAIMETESMFNPNARSPAPAFGLMQLVPTTGARDAYRYLYKKDRIVSDVYLYKPSNNIRLGSAYLNILYYNYLDGIKDDKSKQWATIAAYNTGMGNVFDAFSGKYSSARFGNRKQWKRIALREINRRSPEQVYEFLRQNLSKAEGREYVKKVRDKMPKYEAT